MSSVGLEAAAEDAEKRGKLREAATLWEKACRFGRAFAAARAAAWWEKAFELGARIDDGDALRSCVEALKEEPNLARRLAAKARHRGHFLAAAQLSKALGDSLNAAQDFESAGQLFLAAQAYDEADQPRAAARLYEAELSTHPDNHLARLKLGRLLFRHSRVEPAARFLQRIPKDAEQRPAALRYLVQVFERLGLEEAKTLAQEELQGFGDLPLDETCKEPATGAAKTRLFNRYSALVEVARTPGARVFQATDDISGETVALKLFSAEALRGVGRDALARFQQEATILGKLRHPAIVPLVDFVPSGPATVLKWMSGGNLAEALSKGPLSPARAAEILCSVLSALEQAHRRGILHRDIKPSNVLFDEAGGAYLADFGAAHLGEATATVTQGVIGTLAYMAPEQKMGASANQKSDVYGAGALFWHALTGAPPGARLPFMSQRLTDHQKELAKLLVGPADDRPGSAIEARNRIANENWPRQAPAAHRQPNKELVSKGPEAQERLTRGSDGSLKDTHLERPVRVLLATPVILERASAFARVDRPALASIFAYRPKDETLWVEDPAPLPEDRPLGLGEIEELRDALSALNAAGEVHGAVRRENLGLRGDQVVLRFTPEPPASNALRDREALERLEEPAKRA